MTPVLCLLSSLISLTLSLSPTGDLACKGDIWTTVAQPSTWVSEGDCVVANIDEVDGAMTWIGEMMIESRNWTDYTFEARMTPEAPGGGNGGIAFNIQNKPGDRANLGKYYAISLFPTGKPELSPSSYYCCHYQWNELYDCCLYQIHRMTVHLGKWNDGNGNEYSLGNYVAQNATIDEEKDYFDIKAVMTSTANSVTIATYVDGVLLGEYMDDDAPFIGGSVGMRNYKVPASFTNVCVNGCEMLSDDNGSSVGGWIFIGVVFGGILLYCLIGYIINGQKSKDWGNVEGNLPHWQFWKVLPKLVMVGSQVSYEYIKGVLTKKVGGGDESLMDTAAADEDQGYDAGDQEL